MSIKRTRALTWLACAGLLVITIGAPGGAEAKELSEKSVKVLMKYAWVILPTKFTAPTGKVIEVDKSNKKENMVPLDKARQIIKVARLSAHAQICNLPQAQAANYRTLMKSEGDSKNWTDQQMLYISQLHLFTVMWLTGNVKLVDRGGDKEVVVNETAAKTSQQTCTEAEMTKVSKLIRDYICRIDPTTVEGCS